jgi:hypothetical protein
MRRFLGLFTRFAWLAICVAALVGALHGYQGRSDWKMEEGLGFEMLVLGFPASLLVVIVFMLIGFVLQMLGTGLPSSSRAEMVATWFILVIAGYIQWFRVVPYLIRSWRNNHSERATTEVK